MGLKAFGRPHARCGCSFFFTKFGLREKRLAGPGPYRKRKKRWGARWYYDVHLGGS